MRMRTLLEGRIVFNDRFSLIQCTVRDLSGTEARIAFSHPIDIPPEFELEIPKKGLSVRTRVMWSIGKEHGIIFPEEPLDKATGGMGDPLSQVQAADNALPTPAVPLPSPLSVPEILDQTRHQIAQAMGVPADTIRLKVEIDATGDGPT